MISPRLCLPLALLLSTTAHAVQPPEIVTLGRSPDVTHRWDPQVQAWAERGVAWQAFQAGEGAGWTVRVDARTGTPHRAMGPGIDLGPTDTEAQVVAALTAFAQRHAALLGIEGAPLALRSAWQSGDGAWYVDVDLAPRGMPVWRSGLTFRVAHGRLVMFGADTWPDATLSGSLALSAADALTRAIAASPGREHTDQAATGVWLPIHDGGKTTLRAVWHTTTRTSTPPGKWSGLVDGETGEVLYLWNEVRFFDGALSVEADVRDATGALDVHPLRFAKVFDGDGNVTYTDASGLYSLPGDAVQVELNGQRVRVVDQAGDSIPFVPEGPYTLTAADFLDHQSPLTTYHWLHVAQDRAVALDPENPWSAEKVRANVNLDQTCNAFFDGTVNFFRSGGGCNNTGRLADVIMHEWGHGFHTFGIRAGFYDGSLGEGAADTFAFLITGDSRIAPNFFTGDGSPLRDVDNNARWPEDYIPGELYIHSNGLIFGGSMWDTKNALLDELGEQAAFDVVGGIFARLLRGGPDIETAYDEAVFVDDDDGDLGNGTPHQCALVEGFGKHGLGPRGGQGIGVEGQQVIDQPAGEPATLSMRLESPAPACFELRPVDATVHWRADGGRWEQTPLDVDGAEVSGAIPAKELGQIVEYWTEVEDQEGAVITDPPGGKIRPYTYYVGDVLKIHCDDFEADDGDYGHKLVKGERTEGADDWIWGEPAGYAGDPDQAASGDKVWGNDLGGGNFNGEYQNEKHNRLVSPPLATHHYEGVFLRYQRWLTIEDGVYDQASILADGEKVWGNYSSNPEDGGDHHLDDRWMDHVVDLQGQGDDGEVVLWWDLASDQGLAFGGWTLDDVCLYAPATPDNRLGINAMTATREDDRTVSLSWEQPRHDPVTTVRVVRARGAWPTGPDDGEVVWESGDVDLGAPITIRDEDAPRGGNLYYAAYASDGEAWLSWTREGYNAAGVGGKPGSPADPVVEGGGGCGCAGGGPAGALAWAVGLLALRRRR